MNVEFVGPMGIIHTLRHDIPTSKELALCNWYHHDKVLDLQQRAWYAESYYHNEILFFFQIDIDIEPTDKVNNNIAAYFVYNSFCRMICSAVSISSWNVFILCKNYIKLEKAYIVSGQFFYHPAKN